MYLFTVEPTLLSHAHRLPRCSLVVVPVIRGEVGYCHLLFISSFLSSLFLSRRSLSLVSSSHFIDFFIHSPPTLFLLISFFAPPLGHLISLLSVKCTVLWSALACWVEHQILCQDLPWFPSCCCVESRASFFMLVQFFQLCDSVPGYRQWWMISICAFSAVSVWLNSS